MLDGQQSPSIDSKRVSIGWQKIEGETNTNNIADAAKLTARGDEIIALEGKAIPSAQDGVNSQGNSAYNLVSGHKVPKDVGRLSACETMCGVFRSCKKGIEKLLDNPTLSKLDHEKNARFDPDKLVDRLLLKHKDHEKVFVAVVNIFLNDERFNNSDQTLFEFSDEDKEAILFRLSEAVVDQQIQEGQKPKKEDGPKELEKQKKLEKDIAFDLVGLVKRKPTKIEMNDHKEVVQTHGHVENDTFIPGQAVSANLGNTEQKLTEIPNQAIIATKEEVWVNRSARTNTKEKIFEKSTAGIATILNTDSHKGLKPVLDSEGKSVLDATGRPIYTTCRSDVTLMDLSPLKSLYTTVKSGSTSMLNTLKGKRGIPVESERAFVQSKREMAHAHWKENGKVGVNGRYYIDRHMEIKDSAGAKRDICVREYEPLVFNFAFSAQAKSPANVKAARRDNIPGALLLMKDWAQLNSDKGLKYAQLLKSDKPSKLDLEQLKVFIEADTNLTPKEKLALQGLYITLTGKGLDGTDFDNVEHADEQFTFLCHLSDIAQSPISVECKSGNDRTATAASLRCAMKDFEENQGKPYDPKVAADLPIFKDLFNKYMVAFTPPNLRASRGLGEGERPDVKSKTSPAARKYLDMESITSFLNVV